MESPAKKLFDAFEDDTVRTIEGRGSPKKVSPVKQFAVERPESALSSRSSRISPSKTSRTPSVERLGSSIRSSTPDHLPTPRVAQEPTLRDNEGLTVAMKLMEEYRSESHERSISYGTQHNDMTDLTELGVMDDTDINPDGGGTFICPDGIPRVAKHLYDHPEGVSPYMVSRKEAPRMDRGKSLDFFCDIVKSMPKESFVEATGKVGDVYLLHPLMLHSASNNKLRQLRVITNPPVSLQQPFVFDRKDPSEYSVVERKTIAALGENSLEGWRITHAREEVVPERLKRQNAMKLEEQARLQALKESSNLQQVKA